MYTLISVYYTSQGIKALHYNSLILAISWIIMYIVYTRLPIKTEEDFIMFKSILFLSFPVSYPVSFSVSYHVSYSVSYSVSYHLSYPVFCPVSYPVSYVVLYPVSYSTFYNVSYPVSNSVSYLVSYPVSHSAVLSTYFPVSNPVPKCILKSYIADVYCYFRLLYPNFRNFEVLVCISFMLKKHVPDTFTRRNSNILLFSTLF